MLLTLVMARLSFALIFLTLSLSTFAVFIPRNKGAELVYLDTDHHSLTSRQESYCTNTAATRQCWGRGYSVATNYDAVWPNTGRVVKDNLEIQNLTLAPDGLPRTVYGINGQFPGPTIRASWGDTLQITVKNFGPLAM